MCAPVGYQCVQKRISEQKIHMSLMIPTISSLVPKLLLFNGHAWEHTYTIETPFQIIVIISFLTVTLHTQFNESAKVINQHLKFVICNL